MTQNRIAMTFQPDRLERIDGSLNALEADLDLLIALTVEERQDLVKMGHKSRAFCATALSVAEQHAGLMPRDFDIDAFRQDHLALELLRPRAARLAESWLRLRRSPCALMSTSWRAARCPSTDSMSESNSEPAGRLKPSARLPPSRAARLSAIEVSASVSPLGCGAMVTVMKKSPRACASTWV